MAAPQLRDGGQNKKNEDDVLLHHHFVFARYHVSIEKIQVRCPDACLLQFAGEVRLENSVEVACDISKIGADRLARINGKFMCSNQ